MTKKCPSWRFPNPGRRTAFKLVCKPSFSKKRGIPVSWRQCFTTPQRKRRLRVPVTDELRQEKPLATLDGAKKTATGRRPLPLVNDVRCVRCSLQPVCLPDEVNFERMEAVKPRLLWPPRDDGIHVVAQVNGTKIGVRGMSVRVSDKDGAVLKGIPHRELGESVDPWFRSDLDPGRSCFRRARHPHRVSVSSRTIDRHARPTRSGERRSEAAASSAVRPPGRRLGADQSDRLSENLQPADVAPTQPSDLVGVRA